MSAPLGPKDAGTAAFPHLPAESWRRFLDEELPAAGADRIEAHLQECLPCREALEAADPSRLFRRLRGLRVRDTAWEGFWEDVRHEIDSPAPVKARGPWGLGVAAALAAALLLAIAGVQLLSRRTPTVATDPDCPSDTAKLNLSREECEALFGSSADLRVAPEVILKSDLDLRGL